MANEAENDAGVADQPTEQASASAPGIGRSSGPSQAQIFLCLAILIGVYGPVAEFSRRLLLTSPAVPRKDSETPRNEFSEERAMRHIQRLAGDIGIRHEGSKALNEGRDYIVSEIQRLAAIASPRLRVELDVGTVDGSFAMHFLFFTFTHAFQNLTNVAVRVSDASIDPDQRASVLVNSHYDSAIGSPGAADCGTCVAAMLEGLRIVIEADQVPAAPLIFLFNGGEEIFMKATQGFVTSHAWSPTIGAMINFEANGAKLPEQLVQAGPGSWINRVYAERAVHPSGSIVAQDVFSSGLVPGDTDYRMFSADYDDVPGMDMVMLLGSQVYHTPMDTVENVMPGALQVRGDNLMPILEGLTRSPELRTREERRQRAWREGKDKGAGSGDEIIWFDLFLQRIVIYSRSLAVAMNAALLVLVFFLVPSFSSLKASGMATVGERLDSMMAAMLTSLSSWLLALLLPVILAVLRVALSGTSMSWFANPLSAIAMFAPMAAVGLMLPQMFRAGGTFSEAAGKSAAEKEARYLWSAHWGGFVGFMALLGFIFTVFLRAGAGYFFFWWAVFMLPALACYRGVQGLMGRDDPMSIMAYLLPGIVPLAYCMHQNLILVLFIAEKMTLGGTMPGPIGPFIPDVAVSLFVSLACFGTIFPFVPILMRWFGRSSVVRTLIYFSLLAALRTSQLFPYSLSHPKHIMVLKHVSTQPDSASLPVPSASLIFATSDANGYPFLFKHVPSLYPALGLNPDLGFNQSGLHNPDSTEKLGLFPLSALCEVALSIPATPDPFLSHPSFQLPRLSLLKQHWVGLPAGNRSGSSSEESTQESTSQTSASGKGDLDDISLDVVSSDARLLEEEEEEGPQSYGLLKEASLNYRRRLYLELTYGNVTQSWAAVVNITAPLTAWSLTDKLPEAMKTATGASSYLIHYGTSLHERPWRFWIEVRGHHGVVAELGVFDHRVDKDTASILKLMPPWAGLFVGSMFGSTYRF